MALRDTKGIKGAEKSQKEQIAELEEDIERLRVTFEQYFLGIEKRPPLDRRAELQRTIRLMQGKRIVHHVTRFQFQGLVGRFNILDSYWTRTLRKIEDGTYERDLFRMKMKQKTEGAGAPRPPEGPRPEAEPATLVSEDRLRKVYDDYINARRFCGESVDGLAYDRLRAKLLAEAPKLAEKAQVARIDFQVVIREGKAILKAVPAKDE